MTTEVNETLEEQELTGDPKEESEGSVAEGEPKPEGQLGDELEPVEGEGGVAPPEGAPAISKEELFRREAQSEKDRRIAVERRAAYLEGLVESSRKPAAPVEPVADPVIAKLNQVETNIIEDYGEGSTEHEHFKVSRIPIERERFREVQAVEKVYDEFEKLPNSFYNAHPILHTDDVFFAKFNAEVDLRMSLQGGYDNFYEQVKNGAIPLGENSIPFLKNIFEESFKAASGKAVSDNKGKLAVDKLKKATETLGNTGGRAPEAPANSSGSYRSAFEQTQRFNREIFEKFR